MVTKQYKHQHLANLRDWLLPILMNGQVRVGSGAERNAGYDMEEGKRIAVESKNKMY
jgi:hypothetical protein